MFPFQYGKSGIKYLVEIKLKLLPPKLPPKISVTNSTLWAITQKVAPYLILMGQGTRDSPICLPIDVAAGAGSFHWGSGPL